jgi:hypothetical protein
LVIGVVPGYLNKDSTKRLDTSVATNGRGRGRRITRTIGVKIFCAGMAKGSGLSIDLPDTLKYFGPRGEEAASRVRRGLLPRDCPGQPATEDFF